MPPLRSPLTRPDLGTSGKTCAPDARPGDYRGTPSFGDLALAQTSLAGVLRHVHELVAGHDADRLPDAELLERFTDCRDGEAFAALVRRHGGLVLGVARRVVADIHEAEDVFQATFLLLARRAGSVRDPRALAAWLHGSAHRLALQARDRLARRPPAPALRPEAALADPAAEVTWRELGAVLDEELRRLPERQRAPLVLCYLKGWTQDEAAQQLGWSKGTLRRRLGEARERLHARLVRRGVSLSVGLLATGLAQRAAEGALSPALVRAVVGAAVAIPSGAMPAALPLSRLKATAALLLAAAGLFAGTGWLTVPTSEPTADRVPTPRAQAARKTGLDFYGDPLPEGALARMGTARLRHSSATHLTFSPDGKSLYTAGRDHAVRDWDLSTGRRVAERILPLPDAWQMGTQPNVGLCANGRLLAQVTRKHVHVWNVAEAKELHRFPIGDLPEPGLLRCLEISADGRWLAAGEYEGAVRVWDLLSGKQTNRLKLKERQVSPVALASDGVTLAACSGRELKIWQLPEGRELQAIDTGYDALDTLSFSPDGKGLLATGQQGAALWHVATGTKLTLPIARTGSRNAAAFAPDGHTFVLGDHAGITIRDVVTGAEVRRLSDQPSGWLWVSPDGKTVASLWSGVVRLWDVKSGRELQARASHAGEVSALAFSPDGRFLASSTSGGYATRLWEAATGKPVGEFRDSDEWVQQLNLSSDAKSLLVVGARSARLLDLPSGRERGKFTTPALADKELQESLRAGFLASDGRSVTALAMVSDGIGIRQQATLTTWDTLSAKVLRRGEFDGRGFGGCLSSDGRRVGFPVREGFAVREIETNRELCRLPGHLFLPPAFSGDGKLIAIGGVYTGERQAEDGADASAKAEYRLRKADAETVRVWDVDTRRLLISVSTGGEVWQRTFSRDGRYLLTEDLSGLRLWELATGKEILFRAAHESNRGFVAPGFANCLAFAPDGRSAATGHADGTVLVWDFAPASRGKPPAAADYGRLWADLASGHAPRAYHAAGMLTAAPAEAVRLLRERLRPAALDVERVRRLIAELDGERFAVREATVKALKELDTLAESALSEALKGTPSSEARKAINALLPVPWTPQSPDVLRQVRAVAVLERVGTPEAREVLERLAAGAPGARQTKEAKAALDRLARSLAGR